MAKADSKTARERPTLKGAPEKLPPRLVASDGYVVEFGGRKYRPHKGEWIKLRGQGRMGDVLMVLKLQRLESLGSDMTPEDADAASDALRQIFDTLKASVIEWNWTDDRGDAYPNPPTLDALQSLSPDECNYLIGEVMGAMPDKDEAKNS